MATLYITEFADLGRASGSAVQIATEPEVASQTVAIGGLSTQSSAFNNSTKYVRLHTDNICSVMFGTNPTATAAKRRLSADGTEYFGVPAGLAYKVAVITNS